jgi:hypothetical protein
MFANCSLVKRQVQLSPLPAGAFIRELSSKFSQSCIGIMAVLQTDEKAVLIRTLLMFSSVIFIPVYFFN